MIKNFSPQTYVISTSLAAFSSIFIFYVTEFKENLFLLPLLLLAIFYGALNFKNQLKLGGDYEILRAIKWVKLLNQAMARYVVWLLIIYLGSLFYSYAPYYSSNQFAANAFFFQQLLRWMLYLGLPYFILTLILRSSRKEDYYDPAVRLIYMVKHFCLRTIRGKNPFYVFKNIYNRKVLLTLVMRMYFIPILVIQVFWVLSSSLNLMDQNINNHQFLSLLYLFITFLWVLDITNSSLAYCLESRWLENRSRSIDLNITGWLVCLSCYAPLNMATSSLFPWAPGLMTDNPQDLLYSDSNFLLAIKLVEALVLAVHIYATVSLGPSVANITFKKLQTQGLYGKIRHPGVVFKLLYWFIQSVFYKKFWALKYIYGYLMWSVIYVLRAFTEERHLKKFAEYRAYMKQVKYRFIPRIF